MVVFWHRTNLPNMRLDENAAQEDTVLNIPGSISFARLPWSKTRLSTEDYSGVSIVSIVRLGGENIEKKILLHDWFFRFLHKSYPHDHFTYILMLVWEFCTSYRLDLKCKLTLWRQPVSWCAGAAGCIARLKECTRVYTSLPLIGAKRTFWLILIKISCIYG